ncbi:MAG: TIGR02530 family flagellar biosynthesis protein [Ignavibacteria bacterium]|jgi:flagellar operon protein
MAEINGVQVPFVPIVTDQEVSGNKVKAGTGFESIFERELEKIKFSNHAAKRLESRDIQLSETDLNKLQSAVGKAEEKGAKDSLVMMDQTAFIVNIPNKTVVTALPLENDGDNVFTNIDSVVFA